MKERRDLAWHEDVPN